jgi:hypothetical protein
MGIDIAEDHGHPRALRVLRTGVHEGVSTCRSPLAREDGDRDHETERAQSDRAVDQPAGLDHSRRGHRF